MASITIIKLDNINIEKNENDSFYIIASLGDQKFTSSHFETPEFNQKFDFLSTVGLCKIECFYNNQLACSTEFSISDYIDKEIVTQAFNVDAVVEQFNRSNLCVTIQKRSLSNLDDNSEINHEKNQNEEEESINEMTSEKDEFFPENNHKNDAVSQMSFENEEEDLYNKGSDNKYEEDFLSLHNSKSNSIYEEDCNSQKSHKELRSPNSSRSSVRSMQSSPRSPQQRKRDTIKTLNLDAEEFEEKAQKEAEIEYRKFLKHAAPFLLENHNIVEKQKKQTEKIENETNSNEIVYNEEEQILNDKGVINEEENIFEVIPTEKEDLSE